MIQYVVQSNLVGWEKQKQIAQGVLDSGAKLFELQVIPFTEDIIFPNTPPDKAFPIVPLGSTKLVKLAQNENWNGIFYNENFKMSVFNKNRTDMLNQNADFFSVKHMEYFIRHITHYYPEKNEQLKFIKPDEDLKSFSGKVSTYSEMRDWCNSKDNNNPDLDINTVVAIADPVNILFEWRCFVVGGEVVTATMYKDFHHPKKVYDIVEFHLKPFQMFADKWLPHECCVMDIAHTDIGYRVIEFNCLNCAGFYNQNDILPVIEKINKYLS